MTAADGPTGRTGRMTLRVYRVDRATGARTELPVTRSEGSPRSLHAAFPPCRCLRCADAVDACRPEAAPPTARGPDPAELDG